MEFLRVKLPARFDRKKPIDKPINDKFDFLRFHCEPSTSTQVDQFQETANVLIRANPARMKEIQEIVFDVAREIKPVKPVDTNPSALKDRQDGFLRYGISRLEAIQAAASTDPGAETHVRAETCQEGQKIFAPESNLQHSLTLSKPASSAEVPEQILVYKMMDPGAAPVKIDAKVVLQCLSGRNSDRVTCGRVRRHLQWTCVAKHPHLWVKYYDIRTQPRTGSGVFWEWLPADRDIRRELERIEFVDYGPRTYIIALKFMKRGADKEMEETPEPLEIPPSGTGCCPSKCGDLKAHLDATWPTYIAIEARKIPDGDNVLEETFDDALFDPFTNPLVVHVIPLPRSSSPSNLE